MHLVLEYLSISYKKNPGSSEMVGILSGEVVAVKKFAHTAGQHAVCHVYVSIAHH